MELELIKYCYEQNNNLPKNLYYDKFQNHSYF